MKGRGPDEWDDGGNRFQDAWNSRQRGGGRQHKQVGRLSYNKDARQKMGACYLSDFALARAPVLG